MTWRAHRQEGAQLRTSDKTLLPFQKSHHQLLSKFPWSLGRSGSLLGQISPCLAKNKEHLNPLNPILVFTCLLTFKLHLLKYIQLIELLLISSTLFLKYFCSLCYNLFLAYLPLLSLNTITLPKNTFIQLTVPDVLAAVTSPCCIMTWCMGYHMARQTNQRAPSTTKLLN